MKIQPELGLGIKDEYAKFGLRQNTEVNEFENALLLYEVMQVIN